VWELWLIIRQFLFALTHPNMQKTCHQTFLQAILLISRPPGCLASMRCKSRVPGPELAMSREQQVQFEIFNSAKIEWCLSAIPFKYCPVISLPLSVSCSWNRPSCEGARTNLCQQNEGFPLALRPQDVFLDHLCHHPCWNFGARQCFPP
jgi:hypothetical protein